MLGLVTGKCFDKGPEIRVESGNGRHSKWRSLNSTLNSITFPFPKSSFRSYGTLRIGCMPYQHMTKLFVGDPQWVSIFILNFRSSFK